MYDIYSNNEDDSWRYTLGKAGRRNLLTIGLNPSTATQEKADPTVARVEQVALKNGYDGFVMLNLSPIRATDYKTLPTSGNITAFERNLEKIEAVVAAESEPVIWAAWGASIEYHTYFIEARDELFNRLRKYDPNWIQFGEPTAAGHPRHPSRLQYSWTFAPYNGH